MRRLFGWSWWINKTTSQGDIFMLIYYVPLFPFIPIEEQMFVLFHLWFWWFSRNTTYCVLFHYSVSSGGFNLWIFFFYENLKVVQAPEIHSSLEKELQSYRPSQMTGKYFKIRVCELFSADQLQWHIQVF